MPSSVAAGLAIWFGLVFVLGASGAFVRAPGVPPVPAIGVTTFPVARLPLVLIPAFFVPLFVMLHLVTLFQVRRSATSKKRNEQSSRAEEMAMSHIG